MPVETVRLEKAIYLSRWLGRITIEDLVHGQRAGDDIMRQYGEAELPYVLIGDLVETQSIEPNIQAYRELFKGTSRMISALMINAPSSLKFVGEIFVKINPSFRLEFYDTLDEALVRARQILADHI